MNLKVDMKKDSKINFQRILSKSSIFNGRFVFKPSDLSSKIEDFTPHKLILIFRLGRIRIVSLDFALIKSVIMI
jgi:hypothetical protein